MALSNSAICVTNGTLGLAALPQKAAESPGPERNPEGRETVRWGRDLDAALETAQNSGKPCLFCFRSAGMRWLQAVRKRGDGTSADRRSGREPVYTAPCPQQQRRQRRRDPGAMKSLLELSGRAISRRKWWPRYHPAQRQGLDHGRARHPNDRSAGEIRAIRTRVSAPANQGKSDGLKLAAFAMACFGPVKKSSAQ